MRNLMRATSITFIAWSFLTTIHASTIIVNKGDITKTSADAMVNAANEGVLLVNMSGVTRALYQAAGNEGSLLQQACFDALKQRGVSQLVPGQAIITPSFGNLKKYTNYIIHAVGPRAAYNGAPMTAAQKKQLTEAYATSLQLADEYKLTSIVFPFISAGIFGCAKKDAATVALEAVKTYMKNHPQSALKTVMFALFDNSDYALWAQIMQQPVEWADNGKTMIIKDLILTVE